jgi:hypothetical protein
MIYIVLHDKIIIEKECLMLAKMISIIDVGNMLDLMEVLLVLIGGVNVIIID